MVTNLKSVSLAATVVLILALGGLLIRHAFFASRLVFVAVQVVAALLMIWARLTFGVRSFHAAANPTEGGLVTKGPYQFVRHPIYAAILLFMWAGVASHASPLSVLLAIVASGAIAVRIVAEERLVTQRYPEYAAYAARTKRVIPFL